MVVTLSDFGQDVGAYYVYLFCTLVSKDGVNVDRALSGSTVGSFCALIKDASAYAGTGLVRSVDVGCERGAQRGQNVALEIEGVDSSVPGGSIGGSIAQRVAVYGSGDGVDTSRDNGVCGFLERANRMLRSNGEGLLSRGAGDVRGDARVGVEQGVECVVQESDHEIGPSERTLANRARREKAKARKKRKQGYQRSAAESSDWNDDKVRRSRGFAVGSRGYFASCADEVRQRLVETRARRLTVENELRVKEMEIKMSTMELQRESRLNERRFENERMKVEIEARRNADQLPGGTVETVVSSGSVSPNSSISLAAENKLRKDLAEANGKLAKLTAGSVVGGSGVGGSLLSPAERELRLANFELESIRLKERAYADYTFTDNDYKLSLQSLRDEFADVLLSDDKRVARKAVNEVLEAFADKVDDDMLEKVVNLGYIDGDTVIY